MKINSGEKIRKMRKDKGYSQEEMADKLYISVRQLSRIETGEADMDIWQFVSFMEMLGYPTEDFWLLYLESNEYEEYKLHKRLKRLIRDDRIQEAREALAELREKGLSKRPLIGQFIAYVEIAVNVENLTYEQAFDGLNNAIRMSIKDFNESKVSEYNLTYNEILIINQMAIWINRKPDLSPEDRERAIALTKAIMESRETSRTSEEDKALTFPSLMSNLSGMLGKSGRYKESLKVCNRALEFCREYNNLLVVPKLMYNIACCYHLMGEEEQIYKPYLVRAYHCAYAIGDNEAARIIKNDAEKSFGITDL